MTTRLDSEPMTFCTKSNDFVQNGLVVARFHDRSNPFLTSEDGMIMRNVRVRDMVRAVA